MASLTWPQGNTHTALPVTCQDGVGANVTPLNLSSNTGITLSVQPSGVGQQVAPYRTLTGVATVTSAAAGQFSFVFSAADVATPGTYNLIVRVAFTGSVWVSAPSTIAIIETQ